MTDNPYVKLIRNYRAHYGWSVRKIAYVLGLTVPMVHAMVGCRDGDKCQGPGCHV